MIWRWHITGQTWIRGGLLCLGGAILTAVVVILNDPENMAAWLIAAGGFTAVGIIGVITIPISKATKLIEQSRELITAGKFQEALPHLDHAIRLCPRLANAYIARSAAYTGISQLDRALEDAEHAIRLAPRMPEARLTRARLYGHRGLYEDAIYDLQQGINHQPNWAVGYLELAQIQIKAQDYESSLATLHDLNQHTSSERIRYDSFIWAGWVYEEKLKDLDKAIATYTRAIPLLPDRKIGYLLRAYAYRSRGDMFQAAEDLLRAAQRPPTTEDQGQYHWLRAACFGRRYTITGDEKDLVAWVDALKQSAKEDVTPFSDQSRQWLQALVANQVNSDMLRHAMSAPPELRIFPN